MEEQDNFIWKFNLTIGRVTELEELLKITCDEALTMVEKEICDNDNLSHHQKMDLLIFIQREQI